MKNVILNKKGNLQMKAPVESLTKEEAFEEYFKALANQHNSQVQELVVYGMKMGIDMTKINVDKYRVKYEN